MVIVLERHYAVLTELFAGCEILVVTCTWSECPEPAPPSELDLRINPHGVFWTTLLYNDDPDPELRTYIHLSVDLVSWKPGSIDPLLRAVADDEAGGVMIATQDLRRIYHPYDGGADVLLEDAAQRDRLRARHPDWLSAHPQGL